MKLMKKRFMLLSSFVLLLAFIFSCTFIYATDDLGTWTTKASMSIGRTSFCTAFLDGKIYAIGGQSGVDVGISVEEYNPITNVWTTKASMNVSRSNHGVAVVNGKIYDIGGTGELKSVEE